MFSNSQHSNLTLEAQYNAFIGSPGQNSHYPYHHKWQIVNLDLRKKSPFLKGWVSKSGKCCHT